MLQYMIKEGGDKAAADQHKGEVVAGGGPIEWTGEPMPNAAGTVDGASTPSVQPAPVTAAATAPVSPPVAATPVTTAPKAATAPVAARARKAPAPVPEPFPNARRGWAIASRLPKEL